MTDLDLYKAENESTVRSHQRILLWYVSITSQTAEKSFKPTWHSSEPLAHPEKTSYFLFLLLNQLFFFLFFFWPPRNSTAELKLSVEKIKATTSRLLQFSSFPVRVRMSRNLCCSTRQFQINYWVFAKNCKNSPVTRNRK